MHFILKKSLLVLLCSLLFSCASYEKDHDILNKAFAFKPDENLAVIYLIRDFPVSKPLSLQFSMMMIIDPNSRNKLEDALDTLSETSKPAGIPFNVIRFEEEGFARLEMPPGEYNMYTYFTFASQSEIIPSRKKQTFNSSKLYFYKIVPKPDGPYSSTIYHLTKISKDEADKSIKSSNLKMVEFQPSF